MSAQQRLSNILGWLNPQKKRYRYLRDLCLFGLIAFLVLSYQQKEMITGKAPKLHAYSTLGEPLSLSTSQPTLVYFWGTWCPVCRLTSPMVDTLTADYQVISIAVASGSDDEINQFMTEQGYRYPVINDTVVNDAITNNLRGNDAIELNQLWGAEVFPAIYIVDKHGEIRFKTSGVTSSIGMKIRLWLAKW
ncbi:protein disulfide oxidoreductase [Shewanella sp. AS1]|uniref:protein disulfide oxidoreductase n=1 Tax=Shewanella sp. AS1 TaxID=2907626 RepID=UPI001F2CF121|nr:protein disulfide oxidoreductase [Shewanella sp. AS1]MCE9678715.1 protein disulfide oxidoreductase [Shewanella sp. AS1]